MILLAQPMHLAEIASAHGDQRRDLALVEAADHLRDIAGPTEIVGRVDAGLFRRWRFSRRAAESLDAAWSRIHAKVAEMRIESALGAAIFDPERPMSLDALMERAEDDLAAGRTSSGTLVRSCPSRSTPATVSDRI